MLSHLSLVRRGKVTWLTDTQGNPTTGFPQPSTAVVPGCRIHLLALNVQNLESQADYLPIHV